MLRFTLLTLAHIARRMALAQTTSSVFTLGLNTIPGSVMTNHSLGAPITIAGNDDSSSCDTETIPGATISFCPATTTPSTAVVLTVTPATIHTLPFPTTLNLNTLQNCVTTPGGLQSDNTIQSGCGAMLQHVSACFDTLAPWNDPYNVTQSIAYQSCFCASSASNPFTQTGILWRNYTGCSECLLEAGVSFQLLPGQAQKVENFCRSEDPVAYLFLRGLQNWIASLHPGYVIHPPALTGSVTLVLSLDPLFTATPPLANLAWGASAALAGSLRDLTPVLTTIETTLGTLGMTATSLISWSPISTMATSSTSVREEGAVSSALESGINSVTVPTDIRCFGPCSSASPSHPFPYLLIIAFLAVILGVAML